MNDSHQLGSSSFPSPFSPPPQLIIGKIAYDTVSFQSFQSGGLGKSNDILVR